ncbi:MAG: SH3 domain-containing protein [Anaerolineae bacterium]|nr:SH3 domain-containing protein [Anaerolineae bacterium]
MTLLLLILGVWQFILFDRTDGMVHRVSPEGVESISLSATPVSLAVSVDGRFLAFSDETRTVHIANLESDTCCVSFPMPVVEGREIIDSGVGAISPDGQQVALYSIFVSAEEAPFDGEIQIVNTVGGAMVFQVAVSDLSGQPFLINPMFGTWQPEGIEVFPICYACDGIFNGYYLLWNPTTGDIQPAKDGLSPGGDYLELTGEEIRLNRNAMYPLEDEMMFGPFNALDYISSPEAAAVVAYVEPGNTNLGWPTWVLDGQAALLHHDGDSTSTLVFRTGETQQVEYAGQARLVGGTPDGWVMVLIETGDVHHYQVIDGTITVLPLGKLPHPQMFESRLVYQTPLGTEAVSGFTFSEGTFEGTVCPGFLPSRLTIGQPGRVTPGDANNLRAEPTTQSQRVGQIPGSGVFMVLDGPVCTPGMAWWQVEYNGVVGWTGEGQDNTYWLEPAN